jgi:hypothetical protein
VREKYCWLIAGGWFVLREKYYWLMADKPNEQGVGVLISRTEPSESGAEINCLKYFSPVIYFTIDWWFPLINLAVGAVVFP